MFARIGIALNRWGSGYPERLLFNSRTSLDEHRALGFDMACAAYVPNGFDCTAFAPDPGARARWRTAWEADEDTVIFGLLARYHPAKDHAGFVQAARLVHEARPVARFVMAGTGVDSHNPHLLRAITDAGLGDKVQLLGERRDVADVMAALDVYVSSSARIEAFSNSVGEALCCALPCVVTDVGDSPQLVGTAGHVVPPGDPAALAAAMIETIDMGAFARRALGEQGRARMQAEFDIEAVAGRYADLYRALAAGAPAGA